MVLRNEGPEDANILKGRILLSIKDDETDNKTWKIIIAVQVHLDAMKSL